MAYEPLPMIEVEIDDLALDLDNYRIPTSPKDADAALAYLFVEEDAMDAVKLILRNGYFDNEVPVVVESEGTYIVQEGNRRVSALKALRDPSIAPNYEKEIRALLKRHAVEAQKLPERIRVMVAPTREFAAPHVARLHTGIPKRSWSLDQQANYYFALLGPHTTVDDIKATYPDVRVVRLIRMATARRMVSHVLFQDHKLRTYAGGMKVKQDDPALRMSSFEYAYRNPLLAKAMGMEFDKDGFLVPKSKSAEQIGSALTGAQLKALEYVMSGFMDGRLNTRSREFKADTPEAAALLKRLTEVGGLEAEPHDNDDPSPGFADGEPLPHPTPGLGAEGSPGPAPAGGGHKDLPSPAVGRGPNHPDTKDHLDLSGVDYSNVPVNLKDRYYELRRIGLKDLPAASAILLRSVLEATIKFHFSNTAHPATGQLSDVFKKVATTYAGEKALKSSINAIQSGDASKPGSIQWFNVVAHSADMPVTPDNVRTAWKQVNPVIRRLLQAP